jgi:gliding motility-associated-like protein
MKVQIKRIILLLWITCLPIQLIFSQHSSKNNYTGAWETPTSWSPTWAVPQTNINPYDITINGFITVNSSLSFSGTSDLIINDTLVINGDLSLNDNCDLTINNNAILIVRGSVSFHNHSDIIANGYLIITGDIDKSGPFDEGSCNSNDNPAKVFIGGNISPITITDNEPNFPALNCTAPIPIRYPNSHCSYGDMTDLISDPIYPFFQSTCTIATPTITAGGPTTFCTGGSVNLTSSPGTTYLWSNGAKTQIINVTTAGSYTLKVTNASGCQSAASAAITVTVNALPATPTITAGGPTTFCTGGNVTLTSSAGTTYLWSTGATTASINATTAGSYTVKVKNANGCQSTASAATAVTVNALPATPTITASGPLIFCSGGSVTLTSSADATYLWSTGATTPNINITTAGSYTVKVTNANGCQSATSAASAVTVNALPPTPTITAGGPTTFCAGGNVTLTSSAGTTYLWSTAATTASTNITTAGSYTVQVSNANGCQSAASVATAIVVNALPVPTESNNGPVCAGSALSLTGGPAGMTIYYWRGPGEFTSLVQNPSVSDSATLNMTGVYTLIVTNINGCTNTATQQIIVNETPVAVAGPDQELKFNFETQMNAELSASETGEWSLILGSGHINEIQSPTTRVTELSAGENKFLWKVMKGNCEDTADVKITVHDLFVPSVITPNGDGKNDYFKISEFTGDVELIIVNRWGNEEYTNANYLNDWDGRNNKGVELPADTYFYVLKFENGKIKKGSVLIKR